MNKNSLACGLLLGLAAMRGLLAAEGVSTREQLTNKQRFKIPFQFEASDVARMRAEKVILLESRDQGESWNVAQIVDLKEERFQFHAPKSGRYWFSLRMADKDGKPYTKAEPKPGLKVRVDLDRPEIQLDVSQSSPGTIHITWDIQDPLLEMSTFRLRIKTPGSREWTIPSLQPLSKHHHDVKITQGGVVTVELSVKDSAGNEAMADKSLQAAGPTDSASPRRAEKVAEGLRGMGAGDALSMSSQFPDASRRQTVDDRRRDLQPVKPLPGEAPPNHRLTSYPREKTSADEAAAPLKPRRPSLQVVNTLRFQLRYAVQDVAADDVAAVELYATSDGGASWKMVASDDDLRSPMQVDLEDPGEYGLHLAVRDTAGNGGTPPEDGTAPSMTIIVDQRAPELELLSVTPSGASRQSVVDIAWRAVDEHFGDQPIALSYAEKAGGPWIRIAGKLANTGSYQWEPASPLPEQFYVRIEARDLAGNLRVVETPRAIKTQVPRAASQDNRID